MSSSSHVLLVWVLLVLGSVAVAQVEKPTTAADSPAVTMPAEQKASTAVFTASAIKTTVEPGVGEVELNYEFRNSGDLPLVVDRFLQSCGCMLGEWDGVPVEPGAVGRIKAKFLSKGLRGVIRKTLQVKFVECGTVELVAEVTIPEAINYSARTLRWSVGGNPESQIIDIAVQSAEPVRVLSVKGDSSFDAALEVVEEGRLYRITISPNETKSARVGVFQVRTDAVDPRDALQGLFALVEKARPVPTSKESEGRP